MNVALGGNELRDCEAPLGWKHPEPHPLLSFDIVGERYERLLVSLSITKPPGSANIEVRGNDVRRTDIDVAVAPAFRHVYLVRRDVARDASILSAHVELVGDAPWVVVERLDLRSFGLRIVADTESLRIGDATLAKNVISNSRFAILVG